MTGRIPKRNAERIDSRKDRRLDEVPAEAPPKFTPPPPNPNWHPLAQSWYAAVCQSGMVQFYEPSDWMMAIIAGAETINRELSEKYLGIDQKSGTAIYGEAPMNPQSIQALLKLSSVLGLTEGDRRRIGVELHRTKTAEDEEREGLYLAYDQEREAFG